MMTMGFLADHPDAIPILANWIRSEKVAHEQGYETVTATTVAASGILERPGCEFVKKVIHSKEDSHRIGVNHKQRPAFSSRLSCFGTGTGKESSDGGTIS